MSDRPADPSPPLLSYAEPNSLTPAHVPAWRKVTAILLVLAGLAIYFLQTIPFPLRRLRYAMPALRPMAMIVILAALLVLPAIHRRLAALLDRIRHPSRAQRAITTLLIWIVATAYLGFTAWHQHRDFGFKTQDEFMYLVQVQAIAHGHLWMPQHPMADFFQEFYIFVRPVTSGMYFPGAALMFAPAVWLHLPLAIMALIICGAVVAMTYRVVSETIDAVAGMLASLLLLGLTTFRTLSLLTYSYLPMALLGLLMMWAYLHWRRERRYHWAIVLGALAGWAAITRPLDAIAFFLPICVAILWDWAKGKNLRAAEIPVTLLLLTLAAAPFLAMQFAIDKAVTDHLLMTPVQEYEHQFWPGTVGGLRPHMQRGTFHPATSLPQFQANYDTFVRSHYRGKRRPLTDPFVKVMRYALSHYLLFPLLAVSVLGVISRKRAVIWSILLLFPSLYLAWVMFIPNYALVIAPLITFGIVLGAQTLADTFPRASAFLSVWLTASIAALAIVYLPEIKGKNDKTTGSLAMTTFNHAAATTIHKPALVFFRYHPEIPNLWKAEQAYNADAAWFDDEPIVRAHDLGPRDIDLVNYYAKLGQNRTVYLFDQATMKLTEIGAVNDLANHSDELQTRMGPRQTIIPATNRATPARRKRSSGI